MKGALVNILKYHECPASRDELVAMFNRMKTSSNEHDRFHYIRCWNGTNEMDPINLTEGIVTVPSEESTTNDTSSVKVLLPASGELQQPIEH
jgi:adenylate cyclase